MSSLRPTKILNGAVTPAKIQGCSDTQILKMVGASWTCSTDANSGGTVTSVASGTGLTGGPITGTGTLSLATSGVTAGTYTKVTVDTYGRATSGTTLAAGDLPSSIDATKIGGGSVDNTEFGYLDGVTSALQTQLTGKVAGPASATDNAIPRFDGTTGKLVQNSSVMIDDSGNVGIGTNPGAKLHVANLVTDWSAERILFKINDYHGGGGTELFLSGEAATGDSIINNTWAKLHLGAGGGSSHDIKTVTVTASNVGIGTISPAGKLHVVTSNDTTPNSVAAWDTRHVVIGAAGGVGGIGLSYDQTDNAGVINSLSPNVAWRTLALQSGGGSVGIGTTSPSAKLAVVGGADTWSADFFGLESSNKVRIGTLSGVATIGANNNAGSVWADLSINPGGNTYFGGSVGIGTTGPGFTLDVRNNNYNVIRATGSSTNSIGVYINNSTSGGRQWGLLSSGSAPSPVGSFTIWDDSGGGSRLTINSSGNVGIGTTSPGYTLHVVGTAGLSSGTAWTNASDLRLKDIDGDYKIGLSEVIKLHPVRFQYKKDNALGLPVGKMRTGFIAQEVKEIIPDAVIERDDGYLELNVDPIHWAVVNAIKELKAEKDQEIARLKEEKDRDITRLDAENKQLKAIICRTNSEEPFCRK